MNEQDGRWVTINGTHVFLKDGQSPMDAFIRQKGISKSEDLSYDLEKQGKLTRNKMKSYLDDVGSKIKDIVDNSDEFKDYSNAEKTNIKAKVPDYDNTLLNMRVYGYGMKDIKKMQFKNGKNDFIILATFNDENEIMIYDATKY